MSSSPSPAPPPQQLTADTRQHNTALGRMAEEAPTLDTETVRELCGDYAAFARTNLSEEHGQVARRRPSVDSDN